MRLLAGALLVCLIEHLEQLPKVVVIMVDRPSSSNHIASNTGLLTLGDDEIFAFKYEGETFLGDSFI